MKRLLKQYYQSWDLLKKMKNDAKREPKSLVFGSKIDPRASQGRFFLRFLRFDFSIFGVSQRRFYIIRFLPLFQKTRRQGTQTKTTFGRPWQNHTRIYVIIRSDEKAMLPFLAPPKIQLSAKKAPKKLPGNRGGPPWSRPKRDMAPTTLRNDPSIDFY